MRGWIERRGGPYIAVRSIAQLQLPDEKEIATSPTVPEYTYTGNDESNAAKTEELPMIKRERPTAGQSGVLEL